MSKFKVGDTVECIDSDGNWWITRGKKYVVDDVFFDKILIRNNHGSMAYYKKGLFKGSEWLTKKEYEEKLNENVKFYELWIRYENTPLEYREPKFYILSCPITGLELYINELKEYDWTTFGTKFAQEEIENIPNQELIKALIKKPYKGDK